MKPRGRWRQWHRVEAVRDRQIERGRTCEEEEVQVRMAALQFTSDRDRAGGVPEA
jgi:hypothetical protein